MNGRTQTAALLACVLAVVPAVGQTRTGNSPAATGQPGAQPAGLIRAAAEPLRLESIGLVLNLPEGAVAETVRLGGVTQAIITPGRNDPSWVVTVQERASTNNTLTHHDVALAALDQLKRAVGIIDADRLLKDAGSLRTNPPVQETATQVLQNVTAVAILAEGRPNLSGSRFYVRLPKLSDRAAHRVQGYTVFHTGPGKFLIFDLVTDDPHYADARKAYEWIIGAARLEDPSAAAADRLEAVERGTAWLIDLDPQRLADVIRQPDDRWYRLYRPAPGGAAADAREIGYRRMRTWVGRRGDLDTETKDRTVADHQEGFLLRIDGRLLYENEIVDSSGTYFMAPDRSEEAWVLGMSLRLVGSQKLTATQEIGARKTASMSVTTSGNARSADSIRPHVPERGYVNQVEEFLLPQLLAMTASPGDYGFYAYDSGEGRVRLRRILVERVPDRDDLLRITSRSGDDRPPIVSIYDRQGRLTRTQMADGVLWEPIEFQRLYDLWKRKGLPLN